MLVLKTLASALRWFNTPVSNKRKRKDDDDDEVETFESSKRLKRVELLIEDIEMGEIFYDSEEEQLPLAAPMFPDLPAMVVPTTSSPVASPKASPKASPAAKPVSPTVPNTMAPATSSPKTTPVSPTMPEMMTPTTSSPVASHEDSTAASSVAPAAPTLGSSKEIIYISDGEDDGISHKTIIPPLTKKKRKRVSKALCPGQQGIVSQYKNATVEYKDINFYMTLLMERADGDESSPKIHCFNTFFCSTFREEGNSKVRRWTKRVDIFTKDLLFIPIVRDRHWTLGVIDMKNKCIYIYDSLGGNHDGTLQLLLNYLELEHQDKKKEPIDLSDWEFKTSKDIPQQENTWDCGVFTCTFAERLARECLLDFSQQDMEILRCRMVLNILNRSF